MIKLVASFLFAALVTAQANRGPRRNNTTPLAPTNTTPEIVVKENTTKPLASTEALEYDEYGNVIVKERVYTTKELAAMQAVYPSNLVFSADDIKNGGSVLYLIGK